MVKPGEVVIVHDPDLKDAYCARVMETENETRRNILVKVLYMVRYPIQHAVIWPDYASENAPIPEGCVCRMSFLRRGEPGEESAETYQSAFDRCLTAYVEDVTERLRTGLPCDPRELDILQRHREREFRRQRTVLPH